MVAAMMRPANMPIKTITMDNGAELVEYQFITKGVGIDIYFVHPYCSWERMAIENMNELIRQYISCLLYTSPSPRD